ncbi:G-type lectin S-receptor-like serine/threonine-protein kinase LECRK2 [Ziziphus jujuba]|uniref:G-type lectin S-receptor-like serine/threonine-protein kinase LECRK2 n=1 Tax=Ziziphus jujuba TaxID=326968 RepID=A0ABM3ZUM0_ZIZJJ|nr:G-type lectin S-receptor-like serine/threonine-protein kinase LECRK2 [Ziziphus jujuba]
MAWSILSAVPSNICLLVEEDRGVGPCGFNSSCTYDQRATCHCSGGYSFVDPGDVVEGCKQDFLLQSCDKESPEIDLFHYYEMPNGDWAPVAFLAVRSYYKRRKEIKQQPNLSSRESPIFQLCGIKRVKKVKNCVVVAENSLLLKRFNSMVAESDVEFRTEVSAIDRPNHRNLLKLLGFCTEEQHRLLINEFLSNGSLESFLFGDSRINWYGRIQIASDAARGLLYLHEGCSTQIIHCDIKPQNILLDDKFTAKISDLGLAKLLKKNVKAEAGDENEIILAERAYECYVERKLELLVKDDKEATEDLKRVEKLVKIASWCIQDDPSLRPTMKKVEQMVDGTVEASIPPDPSSS